MLYCVCVKRTTLCNCLYSSFSHSCPFSVSRVRDFGIVNRYSWFSKSLNMADRGGEFCLFQGIHLRTDIRIDISISIWPSTHKIGKQVHLGELIQIRLIKQVLVTFITSRSYAKLKTFYLHYLSAYDQPTWPDGNFFWRALAHKATWSFGLARLYVQPKTIISPLPQCL